MVFKEQMVAEKDHELTRAKDFLTSLLMKGRRLRADALFTQHTMCQEVLASAGHYLLFIQNNHPPCARMCRSSLKNRLMIVSIGAPLRPPTKDMDVSNIGS